MSTIGGKLKLKGIFQKNKERKENKIRSKMDQQEERQQQMLFEQALSKKRTGSSAKGPIILQFEAEPAVGEIITSVKTVHGQGTKFMESLKSNDFITVKNPESGEEEEQKVIAVLSDKSALLQEEFSFPITSYTTFKIRKQDREQTMEESLEEQYSKKYASVTKKIKKQDNEKVTLEYKEKGGMWSWKTHKTEVDKKDATKENLLNMRSKKSRDKFCWI